MRKLIARILVKFKIHFIPNTAEVYNKALDRFKVMKNGSPGLCNAIYYSMPEGSRFKKSFKVLHFMYIFFPELYLQKPEECYSNRWWYFPYETGPRIKCLERAIELL